MARTYTIEELTTMAAVAHEFMSPTAVIEMLMNMHPTASERDVEQIMNGVLAKRKKKTTSAAARRPPATSRSTRN